MPGGGGESRIYFFSQPCKIFMKAEDVSFMFNEMVQRTEQLFFSPVEVDSGAGEHRFHSLPSFLTALADTVRQMQQVHVCTHACVYVCVCMCARMCMYVCACVCEGMYTCAHVCLVCDGGSRSLNY